MMDDPDETMRMMGDDGEKMDGAQPEEAEEDDKAKYKDVRNDGFDQDMIPPDNGAWYCSLCNWLASFYKRFDRPFATFFIVQNINHGMWVLAVLAVKDYYKEHLGLDPGEMQMYISLIHLPWSFKIIYGLISDNVPLCGTRRKSWLIIMGLIQFFALFSLFLFEPGDPLVVALVLGLASLSEAFTNVVSDAIMVIQSRKDRQFGSQDFVTLMYLATGIGGIIGCVAGGLMTQNYHPKWCFIGYSSMGLVVSAFACCLTKESEKDTTEADAPSQHSEGDISTSLEDFESEVRRELLARGVPAAEAEQAPVPKRDGFCYSLRKNCQAIGRALTMREIYCLVIFFIVKGILNPTFSEFSYFFLLNVIRISKFMFALLILIGQLCHVLGALTYKAFCRSVDTRTMVLLAFTTASLGAFLNFCFAKRWNQDWGISDLVFLLFTDVVFEVVVTVLYTLPIMALFAKITPRKIEGTVFATLTGIMNFASTVIAPGMGSLINREFVGVHKTDLSQYSTLCLIAFCCSLLNFALLPLIPTKIQIRQFREYRAAQDEEQKERRRERRAERARLKAMMM